MKYTFFVNRRKKDNEVGNVTLNRYKNTPEGILQLNITDILKSLLNNADIRLIMK